VVIKNNQDAVISRLTTLLQEKNEQIAELNAVSDAYGGAKAQYNDMSDCRQNVPDMVDRRTRYIRHKTVTNEQELGDLEGMTVVIETNLIIAFYETNFETPVSYWNAPNADRMHIAEENESTRNVTGYCHKNKMKKYEQTALRN
jgi:hypothetical protein